MNASPSYSEAQKSQGDRARRARNGHELVAPGGSFAEFPGAVVVLGADGVVEGANTQADALVSYIENGGSEELREAVSSAIQGRAAQINPLLIKAKREGEAKVVAAFDLALLPWNDGAAALLLGRNITLERNLRAALIESRQRYRDLLESACDFAWETNNEGLFTFVTPEGGLGYDASELVGSYAGKLMVDSASIASDPFLSPDPHEKDEIWVSDAFGRERCLQTTSMPLYSPEGNWQGNRGFCRDITERRNQELRQAEEVQRERIYNRVLEIARGEMVPARMLTAAAACLIPALPVDAVAIHHLNANKTWHQVANEGRHISDDAIARAQAALQMGEADYLERSNDGIFVAVATHFRDHCNGLICLWRSGTDAEWAVGEANLLNRIQVQIGISLQQFGHHQELETLSSTDDLTNLLNRRHFAHLLETFLEKKAGDKASHCLLYLDLDNFKQVNDAYGHQEGDKILKDFAARLKKKMRRNDWVSRLGGDEFAVFLPGISRDEAEKKINVVLEALEPLFHRDDDPDWPLSVSIGGYLFRVQDELTIDDLFAAADKAMYTVKKSGKNGIHIDEKIEELAS